MGAPGWPEFASWTASIERVRIVLMQSSSRETLVMVMGSAPYMLLTGADVGAIGYGFRAAET